MGNRGMALAAPLLLALALASAACAHHTEGAGARAPATGIETPLGGPSPQASGSPDDGAAEGGAPSGRAEVQVGYATWYGGKLAGHKMSNGERFDPSKMTAAHRTLPFDTWVEVKRVDTGQTVRVRITDRGPWGHEDRIIDLARAAAAKIDLVKAGLAKVEVRVVSGPD
ncbi:MAG TPA: septal ring lytic transglycosylase RlpA family protein [Polyangiaceae bacterium]|nr:septal ring lytic transglycosylase RlpA family protein [Polyangiaceae bacterium]